MQGVIWHLLAQAHLPTPTSTPIPFLGSSWSTESCHPGILALCPALLALPLLCHPAFFVAGRVGGQLGAGCSQKLPESLLPHWVLPEYALSLGKPQTWGVGFQNGEAWAERRSTMPLAFTGLLIAVPTTCLLDHRENGGRRRTKQFSCR